MALRRLTRAVAWVVCLAGSAHAGNGNLLANPGFERFDTAEPVELTGSTTNAADPGWDLVYPEHQKVTRAGEHRRVAGWEAKCFVGRARLHADTKEVAEGTRSLRVQFLDVEANSNVLLGQTGIAVRPNTVYKLEGRVKPHQVHWTMSHCRFVEYGAEGDVPVASGHRRMINYSTSRSFQPLEVWYTTGPTTTDLSVLMHWRGRPQTVGIVRQPSMVWLDDMRLVEVGEAVRPTDAALDEGFESGELEDWWLVRPGGSWQQEDDVIPAGLEPHISTDQAHSGSRSLKLTGVWGSVERVFSQRLTDCVVTLWLRDEVDRGQRTRMFLLIDERRSAFPHAGGSRGVGLGGFRESGTHYTWFPGPRIPCPYCGRQARDGEVPEMVTAVPRTVGWHELKWDITGGEGIVFYIDGDEVGRTDRQDGFRILQLGEEYWNGFTCYVDDIRIERKD